MAITAHAGWTLDPVSNADPTITHSLPLAAQSYSVFGGAVDSADPSASFSFSWSILLPRTGQTASLSSATAQNPTLQNVSDTWGDVRLFLVATNTATAETSDSDPRWRGSTANAEDVRPPPSGRAADRPATPRSRESRAACRVPRASRTRL